MDIYILLCMYLLQNGILCQFPKDHDHILQLTMNDVPVLKVSLPTISQTPPD